MQRVHFNVGVYSLQTWFLSCFTLFVLLSSFIPTLGNSFSSISTSSPSLSPLIPFPILSSTYQSMLCRFPDYEFLTYIVSFKTYDSQENLLHIVTHVLGKPEDHLIAHEPTDHPTADDYEHTSHRDKHAAYTTSSNPLLRQQPFNCPVHNDTDTFHWSFLKRTNFVALKYPTDFIVLRVSGLPRNRDRALQSLKTNPHIKYVTAQQQYRSLLSVSEEYDITHISASEDYPVSKFRIRPEFLTDMYPDENESDDLETRLTLLVNSSHTPPAPAHSRKLCQHSGSSESVSKKYAAGVLWERGFTGHKIRVAIFDTGLGNGHSHFKSIEERTNWTDEQTMEDTIGHGTFVAGVIASSSSDCLGFAPDSQLFIFRVFNYRQLSFTSWFLDAFNYAIVKRINVLNLSIGGPDFMDSPFVDKVMEMSANRITIISAIGNDGPLYGTLNNPADQMDVIGVGGIDDNNVNAAISSFSSRGMTTWELPSGYGRMKPDLVALAKSVRGSKIGHGCRTLSGTSVASPVVAGAVALLASTIPEDLRDLELNPARMKQALIESANRMERANVFEQGNGHLDLVGAFNRLHESGPHVSANPSRLDLTDCPYFWPYCSQEIYFDAIPTIVNVTILNSISVSSTITPSPKWVPADKSSQLLNVEFTYSSVIWPWSGFLALHLSIISPLSEARTLNGNVTFTVESILPTGEAVASIIDIPLKIRAIPTPPRNRRLLWDQFHNLRYPSGYFPRDNLEIKSDTLDWNGDHPHTNFLEMYTYLRNEGFYLEIFGYDWSCLKASSYGALLLVDSEEEFFEAEKTKIVSDVLKNGLSLIVIADWYNPQVLQDIKFYDENTASWWEPQTGGANLPALNDLLAPFNIAFSTKVVAGRIHDSRVSPSAWQYASGTTIARFPEKGYLYHTALTEFRTSQKKPHAVYGLFQPTKSSGRIVVYGDSNCIDSNHRQEAMCTFLFQQMLLYACDAVLPSDVFTPETALTAPYTESTASTLPTRPALVDFAKYSRVLSPNAQPQCTPNKESNINGLLSKWFSTSRSSQPLPSNNLPSSPTSSSTELSGDISNAPYYSPWLSSMLILFIIFACILFCARYAPATYRLYFTVQRQRSSPQLVAQTSPRLTTPTRARSSHHLYMNHESFERVERMEKLDPVIMA